MVLRYLLLLTLGHSGCLCSPVMLTPLIEAGSISQARTLSQVNEPSLYNGTSYAGYLTVDKDLGNHLFFWFFPSDDTSAPLVVWLNGGPGVSSMLGVFWENGPVMWDSSSQELKPRDFTWVGPFSMLYIENPVGVGFSFSDSRSAGYRVKRDDYTDDLYTALLQFYRMFPRFFHLKLYIGGQSYAGRYIPALARKIHKENEKGTAEPLPLEGIYLGGPSISFEIQTPALYDFAYNMGFQNKGYLDERLNNFTKLMKQVNEGKGIPWEIFPYISPYFGFITTNDNFDKPVLPDTEVEKILGRHYFKKAMHVKDINFVTYKGELVPNYVEDMFDDSTDDLIIALHNYKVLIYNGNYDAVVATSTIDAVLVGINWSGKEEYKLSKRSVWKSKDKLEVKGFVSKTGNLCRVVVHRAGHQTPHDQPKNVLEMMQQFVTHGCVTRDQHEI